jgi:hypothetical protein
MADPISMTAIISSLISTASGAAGLSRSITQSAPELERQLAEIDVLLVVLQETGKHFLSQRPPKSVEAAMYVCQERHDELMKLMDRIQIRHKKGAWAKTIRAIKALVTADKRKLAFQGFRDSVLLLRDLSAE